MDKKFSHSQLEPKLSAFWERAGCFVAQIDRSKQPFTIILPPPNANADLHLGHAMFVYEDVMIRYQKIHGREVLWLPGFDHAGLETQFVFEKHLKKKKQSRFDFDPETLRQMIYDFVEENKPNMRAQLKRLGLGLDWTKEQYTMGEKIIPIVYQTFQKLYDDGLIYRGKRLVNYSVPLGTSYSDLEVQYEERDGHLWSIRYPIAPEELSESHPKEIIVATTRPETMLGDTAVAVHPDDPRYQSLIGKDVILPLIDRRIPIVADDAVDPKFGTGAVKVTPAHDETDWQIGQRHNLPLIQVIGFNGRMTEDAQLFVGEKVAAARQMVVEQLKETGFLVKEKPYRHRVALCYKSGTPIEPLPLEQWFISIRPLADRATKAVEEGEVTLYPKRFTKQLTAMYDAFYDWNISRQTVWGIPIPAFYNAKTGEWIVETDPDKMEQLKQDPAYQQDTDTFDTWFSSGQWPFATLQALSDEDNDYVGYFYPTSVMETGNDILRAWVSRMIMLGLYTQDQVPFHHVFLHGMVRDKHGQKMSKSKGNVINPLEVIDKYGADALRAALLFGTKDGNDTSISEEKIIGMRNFGNKIWNIGRFIWMAEQAGQEAQTTHQLTKQDQAHLKALTKLSSKTQKQYHRYMQADQYSKALDLCYHVIWHELADRYLELLKEPMRAGEPTTVAAVKDCYIELLRMLHPFMPFVTDAVWQVFNGEDQTILYTTFPSNSV